MRFFPRCGELLAGGRAGVGVVGGEGEGRGRGDIDAGGRDG